MRDVINDKIYASINSYNRRDGVHEAISKFNTYKAKSINLNTKDKKEKGKLVNINNKSNNDFLKYCNTSDNAPGNGMSLDAHNYMKQTLKKKQAFSLRS